MVKQIVFTEDEFQKKLVEFSEAFIEQSKKGYGVKLVSNEDGIIINDKESIIGSLMLSWNQIF